MLGNLEGSLLSYFLSPKGWGTVLLDKIFWARVWTSLLLKKAWKGSKPSNYFRSCLFSLFLTILILSISEGPISGSYILLEIHTQLIHTQLDVETAPQILYFFLCWFLVLRQYIKPYLLK